MFKRILCPIDGSDHSRKAADLAAELARDHGAELVFMHVMLVNAHSDQLKRFARVEGLAPAVTTEVERLQSLEGRLDYGFEEDVVDASRAYVEIGEEILKSSKSEAMEAGAKKVETILANGDAARQILRAAKERGCDCIVIGSRGLGDARALFMGSVSHKVLNHADCTCIAVK